MLSFLDTLIGQSKVSFAKNSKVPYIDNIVTDLPKIVALVVPANEYGLYNLRICFDILRTISVQLGLEEPLIENFEKQFESDLLTDELKASVDQIEKSQTSLDEKIDLGFVFQTKDQEFIAKGGVESAWEILINRKLQSQFISYRDYFVGSGHKESPPAPLRLSKEQILARMEADRERHKRAKEGLWRVDRQKTGKFDKSEFSKLWNQFGALTEEEYKELRELNEVSRLSYNF